jgi:hypothetical protein
MQISSNVSLITWIARRRQRESIISPSDSTRAIRGWRLCGKNNAREYVSRLYAVHWDDGGVAELDGRLLASEVALL